MSMWLQLTIQLSLIALLGAVTALIYQLKKNSDLLASFQEFSDADDKQSGVGFDGDKAERWFEKGDLKALATYCEGFIKESPNSVHANWYYALSHYNQGNYVTAREYFENVIRINPLWREGATVYLQEIADKSNSPSGKTLH